MPPKLKSLLQLKLNRRLEFPVQEYSKRVHLTGQRVLQCMLAAINERKRKQEDGVPFSFRWIFMMVKVESWLLMRHMWSCFPDLRSPALSSACSLLPFLSLTTITMQNRYVVLGPGSPSPAYKKPGIYSSMQVFLNAEFSLTVFLKLLTGSSKWVGIACRPCLFTCNAQTTHSRNWSMISSSLGLVLEQTGLWRLQCL